MATYMGIDISLRKSGVSVNKNYKPISIGTITTSKEDEWIVSVRKIVETILAAIEDNKVQYVAIEHYAYDSPFGRETLAEIHGVVLYKLHQLGIPYFKPSPKTVKKFACGRGDTPPVPEGRAKTSWKKVWVVEEVNARYGTNFILAQNDQCDAFCMALLCETVWKVKQGELDIESLPDHQKEAVATVLKIKLKKPKKKGKSK